MSKPDPLTMANARSPGAPGVGQSGSKVPKPFVDGRLVQTRMLHSYIVGNEKKNIVCYSEEHVDIAQDPSPPRR